MSHSEPANPHPQVDYHRIFRNHLLRRRYIELIITGERDIPGVERETARELLRDLVDTDSRSR